MTAFNMMSTAFFSFPSTLHTDKISNWQKTIVHSPVSVVEYYISKFLAMMIDYLPAITVVFSVGHIVRHVNVPMMDWFVSAGILMMGSAAFVVLGLLLALIPNTQFVSVIGNIVYMTLAILDGLWFPLTMFPSLMQAGDIFQRLQTLINQRFFYFCSKFVQNSFYWLKPWKKSRILLSSRIAFSLIKCP